MKRRNTRTDRIIVKALCPFCRTSVEIYSDKDVPFASVNDWRDSFRRAIECVGDSFALRHECTKEPAAPPMSAPSHEEPTHD